MYPICILFRGLLVLLMTKLSCGFFRLEKVKIKKLPSQAKVLGTVLTVGGAMLMTLYKGPILDFIWSRRRVHHDSNQGAADQNWVKGTLMLIASCVGWSGFFILQVSC